MTITDYNKLLHHFWQFTRERPTHCFINPANLQGLMQSLQIGEVERIEGKLRILDVEITAVPNTPRDFICFGLHITT